MPLSMNKVEVEVEVELSEIEILCVARWKLDGVQHRHARDEGERDTCTHTHALNQHVTDSSLGTFLSRCVRVCVHVLVSRGLAGWRVRLHSYGVTIEQL